MNMQDHLRRFPNARPSTLALIQKREEKTAQLRTEIGMNEVSDRRSRFVQDTETKETVLQRFIRKFTRK